MNLGKTLRVGFGRSLPLILQAEAAECGVACLAMILGFHGHQIDLGTLRRRYAVSLKGTTLRDLINLAGAMGLSTRALRLELADLPKLRRPCILHWNLNHFVVLEAVGHSSITIHDPASGRRVVPLSEASLALTGVALEVFPNERFHPKDEQHDLKLRHLFRNVAGIASSLVHIMLLSLGIEIIALLMPIGSQVIIDEVIVSTNHDLLLTVGVGLSLLLLMQLVIGAARGWAIMLVGATVNLQWNTSLLDHLIRLPLDFFEKRHVGDIISRFGSLATIQKALTTDLVQAVLDGVMSVGMVAMMFIYGGWLGWVAMASTALGMLVAFLSYKDQFATRAGSLISAWFQLRMLNVQTDRLADIVMAEPEDGDIGLPAVGRTRDDAPAFLRAENLSLRYGENGPWVLRRVGLEIPPGQLVTITGQSGCGKTTLLKVLMGLLVPTEGLVLCDDANIHALGVAAYRDRIAGVLQDDGLFAGSIAENICGFDPHPDQGWIEECAARAAILADIRRMPMGFESLVGDMGSALSGGQKQRVVLARALYRRPRILFLDEATSHLDEATEASIATALCDLPMTRVAVAHRSATIAQADIVVPFATFGTGKASGHSQRASEKGLGIATTS